MKTREIMSTMGNRMLFCDVPGRKISRAEVMAQSDEVQSRGKALRRMTNDLIEAHFAKHPVSSVHPMTFASLILSGCGLPTLYSSLPVGPASKRIQTASDTGSGSDFEAGFEETPWRVNKPDEDAWPWLGFGRGARSCR